MYKKRHVDNHLEYLQVGLVPQTRYHSERWKYYLYELPGQEDLCWDLWGSSQGPRLHWAMVWCQVSFQKTATPPPASCTLTSSLWTHFTLILWKLTHCISGLRTYSRRNTSTFKRSPFKPIIVYVAAPEMSSAYLDTIPNNPSAEVSCQQSAWIWDMWDVTSCQTGSGPIYHWYTLQT